jgi:hypothetical protein
MYPVMVPEETEPMPEPEASPTPSESPAPVEAPTPTEETLPTTPVTPQKPKFGGFFNRFRRPAATPSEQPALPEVLERSSSEPRGGTRNKPNPLHLGKNPTIPPELTKPEVEPTPVITPVPVRPIQPEKSLTDGLLKRGFSISCDQWLRLQILSYRRHYRRLSDTNVQNFRSQRFPLLQSRKNNSLRGKINRSTFRGRNNS